MKIVQTIQDLQETLQQYRKDQEVKVALVPTMGALHPGHLSLINAALQDQSIVVCSIFVNPTQFTDPKDLEKYPRPLEHDIRMLTEAGCHIVFMPPVLEMYPKPEEWYIDLGPAELVLEGEFRKGHYQGVTQIVKKLFDAVQPDKAYFGQKDFQQVLMIKTMVKRLNISVEIVTCPIIRETDGLAMSSRNIHLNEHDRKNALVLSQALSYVKEHYRQTPIPELLEKVRTLIRTADGVVPDYFVIADPDTLQPVEQKGKEALVALVAATVGGTRLIDNVLLP